MSQMAESSYPKKGSTVSGEHERLDGAGYDDPDDYQPPGSSKPSSGSKSAKQQSSKPGQRGEQAWKEKLGSRVGEDIKFDAARFDACEAAIDDLTRRTDKVERLCGDSCGRMDAYGDRVRITAGMKEFVGQTGTVVGKEGKSWRIRLDNPVTIPGLGSVTDDLWESSGFKKLSGTRGDSAATGPDNTLTTPGGGRRDAARTDPPVSEAQRRAMRAAEGGKSNLGISRSVGKEFSAADPGGKLPEKKT